MSYIHGQYSIGVNGGENSGNSRANAIELWRKQSELYKLEREIRSGDFSKANEAVNLRNEIYKTDYKSDNIQTNKAECATCASRKYVDGSNDSSVSFQTPTHVSAAESFAAVSGHEQEHVTNEKAKATAENREVVSSTVTIHYAVCPECGASYAAGGVTKTTTAAARNNQVNNINNFDDNNDDSDGFDVLA